MKKLAAIVSILLIIAIIAYFFVGNYFYNFALNAKDKKEFLEGNPNLAPTEAVSVSAMEANDAANEEFMDNHPPARMTIVSGDKQKLKLAGFVYEQEQQNHNWAIIVHGYNGRSSQMTTWVRNFHEKGFNVLAPDLRGHGESEGDYIGMGWDDRKDMLLWIDQILQKDPDANIALLGVSMGGATVMMTSGETLPDNVKVIVEDCGYSSVVGIFTYQLKDLFGLPKFPVMNAANTVTKIRAGYDLYEASALGQIAKSKTPMLFIHGEADTFVPFSMLDEVYDAAKVEKEKLSVPGAGHGDSVNTDPVKYWNTVWNFVGKYVQL